MILGDEELVATIEMLFPLYGALGIGDTTRRACNKAFRELFMSRSCNMYFNRFLNFVWLKDADKQLMKS